KSGRERSLNHPVLIRDFARGVETVAIEDRSDEAVVGENEILALFRFHDDGFTRGADARINYHEKDGASRVVGRNTVEKGGGFLNGERRDLMGDIGEPNIGRDAENHGATDGYGVVGGPEVSHKNNGRPRRGSRLRSGAEISLGGLRASSADQRRKEQGNNQEL